MENKSDKAIAVLPFVNMSASEENEYFSDGVTEEIINALAKIDGLKVTSRTSAFHFKGKNIPITEIGRQLNVTTILEGSVRLSGRAMRITAQLIDATEDHHFWSETWDRELDNIFEVQDEISLLIADKLCEHFGHFEIQEHLVEKKTESLDAYTLFLKGRHHFNNWNPEDVKRAIGFYEQALDLDPEHAEAMVGLADAHSFLATIGVISYEEGWGKCAELIHRALGINSKLPAAHYQLANLAFFMSCDFRASFQHASKAIALSPNHVESQQFMAFLYILAGQKDKARKHLSIALAIDPFSQETQFYSGYISYMLDEFSDSIKQLDACLAVNPKNIPVHAVKTLCLLKLGRYEEAINYYDSLPPEVVVLGEQAGTMAIGHALNGNQSKAAEYFGMLKEQAAGDDGIAADSYLYLLYGATGKNDTAFAWVEDAMKSFTPLLLLRFADPLVNPIKGDPRYAAFQKQLFPEDLFQAAEVPKPKKALLDVEAANKHKQRLLALIEAERPYLNPDLSLRSLADLLDIHPNQLSWLLNDGFGKNFNEFINHYRVLAFKRLAVEPANENIKVIALAYDSGFNSKTVFNTYFKKETGQTPKQFLKG